MQGTTRTDPAAGLAHGQPGRGVPVLPLDIGQAGRNRAVARQADGDGDEAAVAVAPRDVAQAVGRIRETVQQHHDADRRSLGLEHVGPVEVVAEVAGVDRALGVVAVGRDCGFRADPVDHLAAHVAEDHVLVAQVGRPVGLLQRIDVQLRRHEGVPRLERRPALGVPGAEGEDGAGADDDQHQEAAEKLEESGQHVDLRQAVARSGGVVPAGSGISRGLLGRREQN